MGKPGVLALVVVMAAAAAACGDDDDDSASGDRVSTLIRAQEGGTLASADGALRVTIPPGALGADTEVSIETSDAAPPPGALSAVYDLGPAGLQFEEPVTLELEYEEESLEGRAPQALHVAFSTNDGLAWGCITFSAVDEATHRVLAAIDHFSQHVLRFDPCDEDGDCSLPETCRLEADEGYCALECEDRTDCPYPLDCYCGVCGRQPCRGGDDDCSAWETHSCSIHDGPGVCHPPCANEGDACGSSFDAGQASCTPGLHCTFDALCADPFEAPFECAAGTSCVHGWCIPRELGCPACDDGAPRDGVCDDLASEDCLTDDDEDGEGFAGCADDADCGTDPLCAAPPEDCATAGDEDQDGFFDCLDTDCAGDPACPEDCATAGDEDQDGAFDCLDTDCAGDPACPEDCATAGDEDQDGFFDCLDTDCAGDPACPEDCATAGDEDQDGFFDCLDTDCAGDPACPPEDCVLPGDEDRDGRPDCTDTDCAAEPQCDDAYRGVPVLRAFTRATTCAVTQGGALRCWGRPDLGVTGQGDAFTVIGDEPDELAALPPIDLGTDRTATDVVLGASHACALLDDASLKCWGWGGLGQLGQGDTEDLGDDPGEMGDALPPIDLGSGRSAQAVRLSTAFTCAILDDGSVKCWGDNFLGNLGIGDTAVRGDEPGEMGDDLPVVDLGTGRTATALGCGGDGCCAVLDDQTVKCWGRNTFGLTGAGDAAAIYGDEPGEMGDALPTVDLGTGALAEDVATSSTSVCALLSGGVLKCWGQNLFGHLGLGDLEDRGDEPGEMGDALPAIDLGAGRSVVSVDPSQNHTCALLDDGSVKCWGSDLGGALGSELFVGDDQGDEPGEMGDVLPVVDLGTGRTAITVVTAGNVSCAILDDHGLKCWGQNDLAQLGLGDTEDRGDEPGEMGDALPYVDLGP